MTTKPWYPFLPGENTDLCCPECGTRYNAARHRPGDLEIWNDEVDSGWQCRNITCESFGVFGEDDFGPGDPSREQPAQARLDNNSKL